MKSKAILSLLTCSALIMAGTLVHREFGASLSGDAGGTPEHAEYVSGWESALTVGHETADAQSKVTIVEFLDLQCPACQYYHSVAIPEFKSKIGNIRYSHVIVAMPLRFHSKAKSAAIASNCASKQGRFSEFVNVALARQSEFAQKNWGSLAVNAQVPDTSEFVQCMGSFAAASEIAVEENLSQSSMSGVHRPL